MKFLCLAWGDDSEWNSLSKSEQDALLAQDDVLRRRGDYVAAAMEGSTIVRVRDGRLSKTADPYARGEKPFAGLALVEAASLEEAIALVKDTPCGHVGAVEVWPLNEHP
jgi:hypothetical protein